ncbi:hypothetical protein GGX14DRAFT_441494 [Mycena pura]|uniref:BAH domain-containing protein n=1 Tax=Mycena pura TaxID=153505 RepID=A0AAD6YIL6_9AGAR|nr:hypothetical protein GGX14DRAFT_441494 [Mycena pura]
MPKGRTKWTTRKRNKASGKPLGCGQNAPTAEEWARLPQYTTFQLSDVDGVGHDFSEGDIACVLPHGCKAATAINEPDYWVCKILQVRARNERDVWIQVHWFYSAQDAARLIPTFKPSHCGQFERLQSNHLDCISSSAFDGLASMIHYDEADLDQDSIPADEFYYRYTIDIEQKTISPSPQATCICDHFYKPSDISPLSRMHLCPQPGCRKYYHRRCIENESSGAGRTRLDFLMHDPDTGVPLMLPSDESASAGPPSKKRRRKSQSAAAPSAAALSALPPLLVRAAAQPLVRGGACGVAGNIAAVVAARRLVGAALRDGDDVSEWKKRMPDEWEATMLAGWDTDDLGLDGETPSESGPPTQKTKLTRQVSNGILKGRGSKKKGITKDENVAAEMLQCPACGGPI